MSKWIRETCQTNGINIHYLRTGGKKPTVVLLHGLVMNGACWTSLARALEEEYDVIMPDARGHGNSSAPIQNYTYYNLAVDVLSFIKALKLTNVVLIGHSMGGMTAALVASQNPEQLRGLIMVDPTFLTPLRQQEVYESNVAVQHLRILNQSKKDFLTQLQTRRCPRPFELNELFVQSRFQTSIHAFDILTPPNPDYLQLIRTITVPSLLVIGGVGGIVSLKLALKLTKINRHLKMTQIKEAGHGIPYDQPEHFSTIVKKFLRTLCY